MDELEIKLELESSDEIPITLENEDGIINYDINLQEKTVTPTKEEQIITADEEYDGLEQVTVNSIPEEYIIPSGDANIIENGTYNVRDYENVNVDVEEVDPTVPEYVKNIQEEDITNWNNKSNFSGNYEDLNNKPRIPTKLSDLNNDTNFINKNYVDNEINNTLYEENATGNYITLDNALNHKLFDLSIDGVCEQETTSIADGDEYDSPSPDYPQEIKTIENSLKITSNNGELEDSENYLFSQITANLPDGEFIGKINDTYKDTLKVEYNEEDGEFHLLLNKLISKKVLNGTNAFMYDSVYKTLICADFALNNNIISNPLSLCNVAKRQPYNTVATISKNEYIIRPREKEGIYFYFWLDGINSLEDGKIYLNSNNAEVYYALKTPYVIDLGVVDMPITYNGITNLFTDSDLMPDINVEYALNVKKYFDKKIEELMNALISTSANV